MSRSSHRFNLIYQAIVATSLGVGTLSAQAVSLGQANIQSAQHEPLSATIDVNGIDAKNFNASVANSSVYKQMGLNQDADIQVKFTPTSDNAGKITLTSKAPISKPFTDVVLDLDNNGEKVVEPQTLLMPIASNNKTDIPETLTDPIMVANEPEQNLPVAGGDVGATDIAENQDNHTANPEQELVALDLSAGDPIELSPLEEAQRNNDLAAPTADYTPVADANINAPHTNGGDEMAQFNGADRGQAVSTPRILSQQEQVLAAMTPEGSNQQINILTEQITRKVLDSPEAIDAAATPMPTPEVQEPPINAQAPAEKATKGNKKSKGKKSEQKAAVAPSETQDSDKATYVVQSGDSLWSIANQIAAANNVSVMEVMNSIHKQNPDAFFNNNINRLKTNASLNLPNYSVVPSQKAIQDAINVNRQTKGGQETSTQKAKGNGGDDNKQAKSKKSEPRRPVAQKEVAQAKPKASKTPVKPLPKPQMTLVTPSSTGQATGTQAKGNNTNKSVNGGNANGNQLVSTLKNTRSQTAANASKVNALNQELTSATQKLQLQNQKLAELEARLKALKDK